MDYEVLLRRKRNVVGYQNGGYSIFVASVRKVEGPRIDYIHVMSSGGNQGESGTSGW